MIDTMRPERLVRFQFKLLNIMQTNFISWGMYSPSVHSVPVNILTCIVGTTKFVQFDVQVGIDAHMTHKHTQCYSSYTWNSK